MILSFQHYLELCKNPLLKPKVQNTYFYQFIDPNIAVS